MTGQRIRRFTLILAIVSSAGSVARAELIYFKNGGRAQVAATVERSGTVRVDTPDGRVSFPGSDFTRVVPGHWPPAEWPERLESARAGSGGDRLAAARWALENGLVDECVGLIREVHRTDPGEPTAARLVSLLDRLATPLPDPDLSPLRRELGLPCRVTRGPHIVLLHRHDEAVARDRVDLLEKVLAAYYLFMSWRRIDVEPPAGRLPSVYLRRRADYDAFLKSHDAGAFAGTLGYYHPALRAVFAVEVRSDGERGRERQRLDRLNTPGALAVRTEPDRRDLDRRRLLFDLECRALDDGTAAHELIHQLVAASGLAPDPGRFPQWLHEGLAAQFEVIRGGRWAGIGQAHDLRLDDWRAVAARPDLPGLIRDEGYGQGYRRGVYARSWSLVYFLLNDQPAQSRAFMETLRRSLPTPTSPDRQRWGESFRAAFGPDLKTLESRWKTSMATLSTPLEDQDPRQPLPARRIPSSQD